MAIEDMIYGRASVEIYDRATPHDEVVEPDPKLPGNAWVRREVFSFCREREGYVFDIVDGPGGWAHADNVRNFRRTA